MNASITSFAQDLGGFGHDDGGGIIYIDGRFDRTTAKAVTTAATT